MLHRYENSHAIYHHSVTCLLAKVTFLFLHRHRTGWANVLRPARHKKGHFQPVSWLILRKPKPINAGTQFSDLGGMQSWRIIVGLVTYQGRVASQRWWPIAVLIKADRPLMHDTFNAPWLRTKRQFQWTGNGHSQLPLAELGKPSPNIDLLHTTGSNGRA